MTFNNTYNKYSYWDPMDWYANSSSSTAASNNITTHSNLENKENKKSNFVGIDIEKGGFTAGSINNSKASINSHNNAREYYPLEYSYGITAQSSYEFTNLTEVGITTTIQTTNLTQAYTNSYDSFTEEYSVTNALYNNSYFTANSFSINKDARYASYTHYYGASYKNGIVTSGEYIKININLEELIPVAAACIIPGGVLTKLEKVVRIFKYAL
jgi:hypothetical protein